MEYVIPVLGFVGMGLISFIAGWFSAEAAGREQRFYSLCILLGGFALGQAVFYFARMAVP